MHGFFDYVKGREKSCIESQIYNNYENFGMLQNKMKITVVESTKVDIYNKKRVTIWFTKQKVTKEDCGSNLIEQ